MRNEVNQCVKPRPDAARGLPRALGIASLAALLIACEGNEPAAPLPAPPAAAPLDETAEPAEPAPPPPTPEPELEPSCDLLVEGERRVERAMLLRERAGFEDLEVVEGRRIKIECPPAEGEREGKIVAQLEPGADGRSREADIVSWEVALESGAEPRVLKLEAATQGPPPELDEEDAAELWPELAQDGYWDGEQPTEEPAAQAAERANDKPKPAALIEVRFNAGRLKWAELRYEELARKRSKRVVLAPSATRKLPAGRYALSVRYPESSTTWQGAGELELEPGKQLVTIKMRDSPSLSAQITHAE